nr:ArdC-like ssDNA-binding domain-containing protein [Bradyrhizobium sp. CCBAU 051011]
MSKHTARVRAGNDRASLYTEITDKIIAELEAGRIPWVQPWGTAAIKAPLAMPRNGATQRRYSVRRERDSSESTTARSPTASRAPSWSGHA